VATLATKSPSISNTVKLGVVWAIGHSLTLLGFCSMVFLMEAVIPESLARGLELAVGIMLVGLGLDVWRKMVKERMHAHVHQHEDQPSHIHFHSHRGDVSHSRSRHQHAHQDGFPFRALFVGFMHGMAGSAALILLTLHTTLSPMMGILYIALFGLGSIAGMAALSIAIALPLRYSSAISLTWLHQGLQGTIGGATIILGITLIYTMGTEFLR
ncbi:MAG: hypothetical protein WBO24_08125, partial [Nitrospirales bacterium]